MLLVMAVSDRKIQCKLSIIHFLTMCKLRDLAFHTMQPHTIQVLEENSPIKVLSMIDIRQIISTELTFLTTQVEPMVKQIICSSNPSNNNNNH